ncbi:alpha-S1-casein isoform X10 [Canis lupus familiaris]|uniref:alpha-S1-casein isoform X10 n=1 Tax=Canis lupus familiaris TaxID=9615 RepID=UPI0018F70C62|nr:alpha-S1-casein isoform X10 [Canis lupus familiaris]
MFMNELDSREEVLKERQFLRFALPTPRELREEYFSELSKVQVMEDPEQRQSSSTSSSEEVVPNNTEQRQIPREDILYQRYLEQLRRLSQHNQLQGAIHDQQQLRRVNENNLLQLPFQQFYQLDAYPYAAWYFPAQIMQYIAYPPSLDITKPIASENIENADVVPQW